MSGEKTRSHYDVLGVSKGASEKEIKAAFRRKAHLTHPDVGGNNEAFRAVTNAYRVLRDAEARRIYDQFASNADQIDQTAPTSYHPSDSGTSRRGNRMDDLMASLREILIYAEKSSKDPYYRRSRTSSQTQQVKRQATIEEARGIFNYHNFFGREEVENMLGTEIPDTPPIPFSLQELEDARWYLDSYLILRVASDAKGKPLSIKNLSEIIDKSPRPPTPGVKMQLGIVEDYRTELFYTAETPRAGWALVSDGPLPKSKESNYLDQTRQLAVHLFKNVYRDQPIPLPYQVAGQELAAKNAYLEALMEAGAGRDKGILAGELVSLQLTRQLRRNPVEVVYDLFAHAQTYENNHLMSHFMRDTTGTQNSEGWLVTVGADSLVNHYSISADLACNGGQSAFMSRRVGNYTPIRPALTQ